jgi:hypothetical protein
MNMNIYMTRTNEANLRILSKDSMSGLINRLLEEYFRKEITKGANITAKLPESDFTESKIIKTPKQAKEKVQEKGWNEDGYMSKAYSARKPKK